MKNVFLVSLCISLLVGCGKAEITSTCSLNGAGEAECTFKNSGKAKGSICEYIVLQQPSKEKAPGMFTVLDLMYEEGRTEIKKKLKSVKADAPIPIEGIYLISNKQRVFSNTEICSGIVEAGDIRQVKAFLAFMDMQNSPAKMCRDWTDRPWSDVCSFKTVSINEIVSLINEQLK